MRKGLIHSSVTRLRLVVLLIGLSVPVFAETNSQETSKAPAKEAGQEPLTEVVHYDKSGVELWWRYYIDAESLRVRGTPDPKAEEIGRLKRNDRVQIVDLLDDTTKFVEVKVVRGELMKLNSTHRMFISYEYLSKKDSQNNISSKYFVIQNVATEVTRVYEKCDQGPQCKHKLIYEADMVVGRRKNSLIDPMEWYTYLGVMKIHYWEKFHEDSIGHYPAWYGKDYPPVPPPGSSFFDWSNRDVMPDDRGEMRGAFGWFTAMVAPNANSQWIHGTVGWGADGDKAIEITRNFLLSSVADARSSGCTRLENGAISFLRHILPPGTPVIRVYAKEAVEEPLLHRYRDQKVKGVFKYILTKSNSVNNTGAETIERSAVLARGVDRSHWLEEGTYYYDRYPTVRKFRWVPGGIGAGTGSLGNVYKVPEDEMKGYFMIDTGRFLKYDHPRSLPVGGMPLVVIPDYTKAPESIQVLEPISFQDSN